MNRRTFLKAILSLPILGALSLFLTPFLRYLRPTLGELTGTGLDREGKWTEWVGNRGVFAQPDQPERERDIVFTLSQFPKPWSFETFTFGQRSREYTFQHFQATKIPGFVVRLPEDQADGKPNFVVVSRICPHMGCVFNFLDDPKEAANYNYPQATHPLFACPCHLSVFDPLQEQSTGANTMARGKVVSGPAPRPPRHFVWKIDGEKLVITEAEAGGIA